MNPFGGWAPCPARCQKKFCSIECLLAHHEVCSGSSSAGLSFGEGFCGKRAPLTWAAASQGIPIIKPYDKLRDVSDDFFLDSGISSLGRFDDANLGAEHWSPDCKLMSRARGRPIVLDGGGVIKGASGGSLGDLSPGLA